MFKVMQICVIKALKVSHSNVFICFASFENPKTYQPAREKNKQEKTSIPFKGLVANVLMLTLRKILKETI
jgi:hypothetical protein